MHRKQLNIFIITFFAAFCSIIYELLYSQLLSVLLGNTVLRYAMTIGLYLFSLGIGAFLFRLFPRKNLAISFWSIETLLALIGPLGVFFIIWLNSAAFDLGMLRYDRLVVMISHLPILVVGILAGIQIPFLAALAERDDERKNFFVEVLGIDYYFGLAGAVLFGLVFYPELGLIRTVLLVGAINAAISIVFAWAYLRKKTVLIVFGGALILLFLFAILNGRLIDSFFTKIYLLTNIERESALFSTERRTVKVLAHFTTPYQEVAKYRRISGGVPDTCVILGNHTNICKSWADEYHDALVHVPMAFFDATTTMDVLVLGGGSLLPIKNLLHYNNVQIDQVDIDGKFLDYAKSDPFFLALNEGRFESPRLTTYEQDAFAFLRQNKKQYDLVVVSLPGYGSEKLIHLGSQEFFTFLRRSLSERGMFVTWEYGSLESAPWQIPGKSYDRHEHLKVLFKGISEAGFNDYFVYHARNSIYRSQFTGDIFYVFTKREGVRTFDYDRNETVSSAKEYLSGLPWEKLSDLSLEDVRASRVFAPNYAIMTPF